jgi:alpha-N-acetylglucosaminidase
LVERLLPSHSPAIELERIDAENGRDVFELETRGGKLVVRGSSENASASGLRHYLEHYASAHVSWGGDRLDLPAPLPAVPRLIRVTTSHTLRYAYNFTVFGYSTPHWDWSRWEREIDLLAMHGFNLALVTTGYEQVVLDTFAQLGYTADEIRGWIVLPAYQPWQWLGNVQGNGSGPSAELIARRAALGRRIVDRMRELGITPVLPGYYGLVPPDFAARTGARVVEQGSWLGVAERPDLLDPTDETHFAAVAAAHNDALRRVFGSYTHLAADPFHEGGSTADIDITHAAAVIQRTMAPAVWVLQAWFGNPRAELLAGVTPSETLVIDLWGDERPGYSNWTTAGDLPLAGAPWLWSIIQNFGGTSGIQGNLDTIASQYAPSGAFVDPHRGALAGLGLTMEAIEHNPVVLDMLSAMIWRRVKDGAIDLDVWMQNYADRRYGQALPATRSAWRTLKDTAYANTAGLGASQSILCARPSRRVEFAGVSSQGTGDPRYDTERFEAAAAELLSVRDVLRGVDPYAYDVVNVTRQVLANRARTLLDEIRVAVQAANVARFECLSARFVALISDQDRLVATRPEFLLGRWLQDARAWGQSPAEADAMEGDARRILTTWTEGDSLLRDYANREWAGLLRDFYRQRWERFFDYLGATLTGAAATPPDFPALEAAWVRQRDAQSTQFPIEPAGDPLGIAAELFAKHTVSPSHLCP